MYLKEDFLLIRIGSTIFSSHLDKGMTSFQLDREALSGWDDGVDSRRSIVERPHSWGDFSETGRYASRLITISGMAVAKTPQELHTLRDEFTTLVRPDEFVEISIQNYIGTRYATVSLANRPAWKQIHDKSAVWKLDLYAPDPHIYGTERSLELGTNSQGGGLVYPLVYKLNYGTALENQALYLNNRGNTTSWPKFVAVGNFLSGFSVSNGKGDTIEYAGPVYATSPVEIDSAKGTATQGGSDRSMLLRKRQWFGIPPEQEIRPYFKPTDGGSGFLRILYRDTWI